MENNMILSDKSRIQLELNNSGVYANVEVTEFEH